MIHGHTRIVLRNPISGNILKDIESENVFQNTVIANGLRNLGNANASPYNNNQSGRDIEWKTVVGGLLLLQNTEQSGAQYMSPTNKMIGNGSVDTTNNGTPNELGSFNTSESSVSTSSIVQVYDFGTSQANGTISSVCLTSKIGGFMGCGNPDSDFFAASASYKQLLAGLNPKILNWLNYVDASTNINKHIVVGNYYYYLKSFASSTLTITKGRVPCKNASIFDEIYTDIAISASGVSVSTPTFRTDGTKLYLFDMNNKTIASGGTYKYWEVDFTNATLVEKTFTNPLSSTITADYNGVSIADGCLFIKQQSSKNLYCFNASTSALVASFDMTNYSVSANDKFICRNYQAGKVMTLATTISGANCIIFLNTSTGAILPTNIIVDSSVTDIGYDSTNDALMYATRYGVNATNNPLYLATINNLGSAVEKTSAKTMKVIYELSEA